MYFWSTISQRLYLGLEKQIYISNNICFDETSEDFSDSLKVKVREWINKQEGYPKEGSAEEYSFYIELAFPSEHDRRNYFANLCSNKMPNIGYKLLILLRFMETINTLLKKIGGKS